MWRPPFARFFGVLCLLAVTWRGEAQINTTYVEKVGEVNEFVDREIRYFKESGLANENFDPFQVPGTLDFNRGQIHSIRIEGLSSLYRNGDAEMIPRGENEFLLSGGLGVSNIKLFSQYRYNPVRFVRFNGHIDGVVDSMTARVEMTVRNGTPSLDLFEIDSFGNTKVTKFSGTSFAFNRLGRTVLNSIVNANKDRIARTIEQRARAFLEDILRDVEIQP